MRTTVGYLTDLCVNSGCMKGSIHQYSESESSYLTKPLEDENKLNYLRSYTHVLLNAG